MQPEINPPCPDCDPAAPSLNRRNFLASIAASGLGSALWTAPALAAPSPKSAAETAVKAFYDTLTDTQKKTICFDWDYKHPERGLLRTHVSNNWQITKPFITTATSTPRISRRIILDIFKGIFNPDWHERLVKQLKDDTAASRGAAGLSIAIFGKPGDRQVRVRHDRPAHDLPGRRQQRAARRLRRADLPRPRRQRLQREGPPSRQRLLAPGRSSPTRSTRSSTASSRSRPSWSNRPKDESAVAFQGKDGKLSRHADLGDVEGPEGGRAEGAR